MYPLCCKAGFAMPEKQGKAVVKGIYLVARNAGYDSECLLWDVWNEHYPLDGTRKKTYPETITHFGTTHHRDFAKVEVRRAADDPQSMYLDFQKEPIVFRSGIRARLSTNFKIRIMV